MNVSRRSVGRRRSGARWVTSWVSLGSNLGDRVAWVAAGVRGIRGTAGVRRVAFSPAYLTEPIGDAGQPEFVNAVVRCETRRSARAFLASLHRLERRCGRRRARPMSPRTLDLDLLLHGEAVTASRDLVVPHPRMHERKFVLAPAADLDGRASHPVLGMTADAMLRAPWTRGRVRRLPVSAQRRFRRLATG